MAGRRKEPKTYVPTVEYPFGFGEFYNMNAHAKYEDDEYIPFAHKDIPVKMGERQPTATEIRMKELTGIQKDQMIRDAIMAPTTEKPFGEHIPFNTQDMIMTVDTNKDLSFDEMLVALFESEPTLIEKLSLIADKEKVSTIDIIIYILNDYLTPTEHK